MKIIIKIALALAIVAGSFTSGRYFEEQRCSLSMKVLDDRSSQDQVELNSLREKITALETKIIEVNQAESPENSLKPPKK